MRTTVAAVMELEAITEIETVIVIKHKDKIDEKNI